MPNVGGIVIEPKNLRIRADLDVRVEVRNLVDRGFKLANISSKVQSRSDYAPR